MMKQALPGARIKRRLKPNIENRRERRFKLALQTGYRSSRTGLLAAARRGPVNRAKGGAAG
jgi:hypothetical protein